MTAEIHLACTDSFRPLLLLLCAVCSCLPRETTLGEIPISKARPISRIERKKKATGKKNKKTKNC